MDEFEKPVYLLNVGYNAIDVTGYDDPTAWQNGDPATWLESEGVVWVPVRWNEDQEYDEGDSCDGNPNRDAAAIASHDLRELGFDGGDFILDAELYVDDVVGLPTIEWGLKVYSKRCLDAIFGWPDGPAARYSMVTTDAEDETYHWHRDITFPEVKKALLEYIAMPYPYDSNPRIVRTK